MKTKSKLINATLFISSTIIALIVAEVTIRKLDLVFLSNRFLMYSSPTFLLDKNGAIRYFPNAHIRSVAVYDGEIEYDFQFYTNNIGFIDYRDYEEINDGNGKENYAFIGDSFTTGHGVGPWVPALRDRIHAINNNIEIYNLGIDASGIEHFYRLLKSSKKQLEFTYIVILAISNDFYRKFEYPLTYNNEIRFCQESLKISECSKQPYAIRIIDFNSSEKEILDIAQIMKESGEQYKDNRTRKWARYLEFSYIWRLTKHILTTKYKYSRDDVLVQQSLTSLKNIKELFPDTEIYLIHLPEKGEVARQRYLFDIGQDIESIGISYFPALKECDWSKDMFFSKDAHPNKIGYVNISDCVSDYLFGVSNK